MHRVWKQTAAGLGGIEKKNRSWVIEQMKVAPANYLRPAREDYGEITPSHVHQEVLG